MCKYQAKYCIRVFRGPVHSTKVIFLVVAASASAGVHHSVCLVFLFFLVVAAAVVVLGCCVFLRLHTNILLPGSL